MPDSSQLTVQSQKLDLMTSTLEDLQIARVITRHKQEIQLRPGTASSYLSEDEESEPEEEDGYMKMEKYYHDNGAMKYCRTFYMATDGEGKPYERLVEEKHYDPSGVCRMDVHFGIGQPYLYRKHYHPNQCLKSEKTFFVEDEVTMKCRKAGHWRDYYDTSAIERELIYDKDGVRVGFCKRYARDGALIWVKDYTKERQDRLHEFNEKAGALDYSVGEASKLLGFVDMPACKHKVNSRYRLRVAPLHPDKQPDPEATELFLQLSRAREIVLEWFEKNPKICDCEGKRKDAQKEEAQREEARKEEEAPEETQKEPTPKKKSFFDF